MMIMSGWDNEQGGIFWRQDDDASRNTCSNGPAEVLAMGLYAVTHASAYLNWALRIMDWLKPLKSPDTGVYQDNISRSGMIQPQTYTYNQGTPLNANVLLYQATGDQSYLDEARTGCHALIDQGAMVEIYARLSQLQPAS